VKVNPRNPQATDHFITYQTAWSLKPNPVMSDTDIKFMQHCLSLAEKGRNTTRPNPVVGALLVKDGGIIAEGWHEWPGQEHAEVMAIRKAAGRETGATLYVTLEPCSFTGKTGPCCDAVIEAGIARVVYGMVDPNPQVAGRGIRKISDAGIEVSGPICPEEAGALNPGFIKRMTKGLPHVVCKLAMSLDGRTAMASGESKWITGTEAREDVQRLRARSSAILTGIETVLSDDSGLDVRSQTMECKAPIRVIVDSRLRISPQAKTLHLPGQVILATAVTSETLLSDKENELANERVTLLSCANADGQVDLHTLLQTLARDYQCNEVLLESGAELAGSMLKAGLVDEVITYIAPKLLGSDARPLFRLGLEKMEDQVALEILGVAMVGKDCRMRSRVKNPY